MNKYESAEMLLNEFPDPTHFHDSNLVNMKFSEDSIHMRFELPEYLDEFGILDDENHFAILEVVYTGTTIKKMDLNGLIDFRNSYVYQLVEKDGVVNLFIHNDLYSNYFNIEFTYTSYKWSVVEIITIEESMKYYEILSDNVDEIIKIQETDTPEWSKFE